MNWNHSYISAKSLYYLKKDRFFFLFLCFPFLSFFSFCSHFNSILKATIFITTTLKTDKSINVCVYVSAFNFDQLNSINVCSIVFFLFIIFNRQLKTFEKKSSNFIISFFLLIIALWNWNSRNKLNTFLNKTDIKLWA